MPCATVPLVLIRLGSVAHTAQTLQVAHDVRARILVQLVQATVLCLDYRHANGDNVVHDDRQLATAPGAHRLTAEHSWPDTLSPPFACVNPTVPLTVTHHGLDAVIRCNLWLALITEAHIIRDNT